MYRISPFTYLIEGMLSTAVANTLVVCATNEYLKFSPSDGQTCQRYMNSYISSFGGYLEPGTAQSTTNCSFCQIRDTNTFLAGVAVHPAHMWRDFGIMWVYIIFNIFGAIFLYWWVRVPKGGKHQSQEKKGDDEKNGSVEQTTSHESEGVQAQSKEKKGEHIV